MKIVRGFFMAWGMFCTIPCPVKTWDEGARKHMLALLPIIGLGIGGIWFGLFYALHALHVPTALAAALMTVYPFVVTGGIHLDGYMDCNDAILSRKPMGERQKILKDSHVGAFAVISFALLLVVYFGAMWSIVEAYSIYKAGALALMPVMTRGIIANAVLRHKPMDTSQYVNTYGKTNAYTMFINFTCAFPLILSLLLDLWYEAKIDHWARGLCLYALLGGMLAATLAIWYGRKQLGGMSGDIAGYGLVFGELATIVILAVI